MTSRTWTIAGVVLGVLLCVTVGVLVGRQTAQPAATAKINPEASARAVAFWKAYYLSQDPGAAWDMALPETWKQDHYTDRADFVQKWSSLFKPEPDQPYELKEYPRAQDYLYMIITSKRRYLVWVTNTPNGWKVRGTDYYDGGEIPW